MADNEGGCMSDSTVESYGWEEVSVLVSDNESLTVSNKQGIDRKMNTSKTHTLSESESSSEEEHEPSSFTRNIPNSRMSLNSSADGNLKTEKHSSSESTGFDCMGSNTSASLGIKETNFQAYKHNKHVGGTEELTVENIDVEEIWLVQCPLNLDPKELVNKEIDFSGISEFTVETESAEKTYTAIARAGRWKSLSCLLPSMEREKLEAVVVNAAGQIIVTEQVMNSRLNSAIPALSTHPKFPENLKERHPLFGADYKKELDIRKQRLLISSTQKKRKKKKKKELSNDISYGTISEDQTLSFSEGIEVPVTSKKAKKRRYSESCNANSDHSNDEDDLSKLKEGRHSKKRLRKSLSESINDSMEIDSSQNQYRKKKKKKKCDTP